MIESFFPIWKLDIYFLRIRFRDEEKPRTWKYIVTRTLAIYNPCPLEKLKLCINLQDMRRIVGKLNGITLH